MATPAQPQLVEGATLDRADLVASLYDRYAAELFGYLARYCGSRDPAEELLQETFLRLVREVRAGRAPIEPRPWLYRVATNLAASRGRRLGVLSRVLQRWASSDPEPSPEQGLLDRERRGTLDLALARLAPDARRALLLAADGFDGPEIAALIGRSPLATRSLMCRARHALRAQLAREEAVA